jgi:hypothetical protein
VKSEPLPRAIDLPTACSIDTPALELNGVNDGSNGAHETVSGTLTSTFAVSDGSPRLIVIAEAADVDPASSEATADTSKSARKFLRIDVLLRLVNVDRPTLAPRDRVRNGPKV